MGTAGVLWGVTAVVVKGTFNDHVDPLTLVQARLAIASALLALGLAVFAPRLLRLGRGDVPAVVVWGCLGLLLMQGGYFTAVSLAGVATALFMQYTAPVGAAVWERLSTRGPLGRHLVLALAACTLGLTALLFGGGAALKLSPAAVAAGALSSFGSGFDSVYGKKLMGRLHAATLLLYGMVAAFLATLAIRWPPQTFVDLFPAHTGQVLFVAVAATLLPFLLYFVGLSKLRPLEAMLLALIEPVVGVLGAWAVLGERLSPLQLAGAGVMLAGVVLAEARR